MVFKSPFHSFLLRSILVAMLAVTVSCGDDDDSVNVTVDDTDGGETRQEEQGSFGTPPMVVINNEVTNNVKAESEVEVEGDTVITKVEVEEARPNRTHRQYIHVGPRCPNQADDRNGDGVVDREETLLVAGKFLLPLDSDIENQEENRFPRSGNYSFEQRGSLSRIISELRAPDLDPNDDFAKLGPDEDLNLSQRVIIVYEVRSASGLPDTVARDPGNEDQVTIPICCGQIERREQAPETTTSGGSSGGSTPEGESTDEVPSEEVEEL